MDSVILHSHNKSCWQKKSLLRFSRAVFRIYAKYGESSASIRKIKQRTQLLARNHVDIQALKANYLPYMQKAQLSECHYVKRMADSSWLSDNIKVALHIISPHYTISTHSHPDSINVVYVLAGSMQVEQFSLPNYLRANGHICEASRYQACVGLRRYRNRHRIMALDLPVMFLSIRLKKGSHSDLLNLGLGNKKLLPWLLSGVLLLPSCDNKKPEEIASRPVTLLSVSQHDTAEEKVQLANHLRESNNANANDDEYKITRLYLQAAKEGNAEAQYWLGVMYLDGFGITEDTDEALHWISSSSDQGYPLAKELLHHILTTDEVLDC